MQQTASSTSSSLIRRVQENDPDAWVRLSRLYTPLTFAWCKRAGLQDADTSDIIQNVFASVYKSIGTFRKRTTKDSFRGWLWKITRNEVLMHFRKNADQPVATGGTDAQQAIQQVPEIFTSEHEPTESTVEQHFVHRALRMVRPEFQESTWKAFWRTVVDGQPASEVADELGMSAGAVRQAKYRVLSRLREFLSDD